MSDLYFLIAIIAALVPVLFWLWFWLREDKEQPEPYLLIAVAFISGMMVVLLALNLQNYVNSEFSFDEASLMWIYITIEESLKYLVALVAVLWTRAVDEPIDLVMYMIFVALGFAALENALFIYNSLLNFTYQDAFFTGSFRFLGATLLHVLASASVGVCMAFAFYKSNSIRLLYGTIGLCIAILLHAWFNFSIINSVSDNILLVFMFVWFGIITLFVLFEKIKTLAKN